MRRRLAGCFRESLPVGFVCPERLQRADAELVEQVNLWHYAMLNDEVRNRFYWNGLRSMVAGRRVLDLGAGSGLLSMMAASHGAASVVAVESSRDLADIAEANIKQNKLQDRIEIVRSLSTDVHREDVGDIDLVVFELFGTVLNGESVVDYLADARARLLRSSTRIFPAGGAQHCVLIASPSLSRMTRVSSQDTCHGLDLSMMNRLQDTSQTVNPLSAWGLQLTELADVTLMSERICLFDLDFSSCSRRDIPRDQTYHLRALEDGVIHAVVASWEVWADPSRTTRLTTHLQDADSGPLGESSPPHFSQAVQLVEDVERPGAEPVPFEVAAGEALLLRVRHNPARTDMQFQLLRVGSGDLPTTLV